MIETIDFEALRAIGLGEAIHRQLERGVADPRSRPMRVVEVQREHLRLHDGRAAYRARCMPALRCELADGDDALAVGDWVLARPGTVETGGATWQITCRLLPQGQISRRVSGGRARDSRGRARRQVLVSNVDTALLVMGLDQDFQLRRLERYLALVRLAGVDAVLVLSKADTVEPARCAQRLAQAAEVLPRHLPALALDLREPAAAAALEDWLRPGRTLVLLGSSGAGKSTLANTLSRAGDDRQGGSMRATGPVHRDDRRGHHTTTARTLLPLPGGACVIDTPGLRALRLDVDDGDDLAGAFGDVARFAPRCRFRDCRHRLEPGCAVRDGVPESRLRNFHKLLDEARRDDPGSAERRAETARRKALGRAGNARARAGRLGGA